MVPESIKIRIVPDPHFDLSADVRQHALEEIQSLLRIAKFGVATGHIVLSERIVGADHQSSLNPFSGSSAFPHLNQRLDAHVCVPRIFGMENYVTVRALGRGSR